MKNLDHKKVLYFLLFVIILLRIPLLYQGIFDIDESVFGEFANKIVAGKTPYIDAIDNKPILNYYFFSFVYFIFGTNSLIAVHFFTLMIVLFTGYFIYKSGVLLNNKNTGLMSLLAFILLAHIYEPKYISTNGETLINLPYSMAIYFFIKLLKTNSKKWLRYVGIGSLLSICFLIRYQTGLYLIPFIIVLLIIKPFFVKKREAQKQFLPEFAHTIFMGLGFLIPILFLSFIIYQLGFFDEHFFWSLTYNFKYIGSGSKAVPITQMFFRISVFMICSFPIWYYLASFMRKKLLLLLKEMKKKSLNFENSSILFLLLSFIISIALVLIGKRVYGHYFIMMIVSLSLLIGYQLNSILERKKLKHLKKYFILFLTLPFLFTLPRISLNFTAKITNNKYGKADITYQKIGNFIKKNSEKTDTIYAWGFTSPIYYYANRECSSRFFMTDFLTGRVFGTPDDLKVKTNTMPGVWENFWKDIKQNPPLFFVDTSPADFYGYKRFPIKDYSDIYKYLGNYYSKIKNIDGVDIYKLKINLKNKIK